MPLRIGLVGYGGFGQFLHQAWDGLELDGDRAAVTAVASEDHDRAGSIAVERWQTLIQRPDVDLVVVASPPHTHAEIGLAAMEAGKHVLVEKPLALTVADADRLIAARDRTGRVAGVDFMLRFTAVAEALTAWGRSGAFGRLTHVHLENIAQDEALPADHWFWDPAQSGGILLEHAVHFLDWVNAAVGAPAARVGGWLRRRGDGRVDRMLAVVEHEGGPLATHDHGFSRPRFFERTAMRWVFDRAEVDVDGWIPLGGRVRALIGEGDEAALARLPNWEETARRPAARGAIEIGGRPYRVQHEVEGRFHAGVPKDDAYRHALQAMLRDVARATRDPAHRLRVTLEDGREALRQAALATEEARGRAG